MELSVPRCGKRSMDLTLRSDLSVRVSLRTRTPTELECVLTASRNTQLLVECSLSARSLPGSHRFALVRVRREALSLTMYDLASCSFRYHGALHLRARSFEHDHGPCGHWLTRC
jgi:hypothetical protein